MSLLPHGDDHVLIWLYEGVATSGYQKRGSFG